MVSRIVGRAIYEVAKRPDVYHEVILKLELFAYQSGLERLFTPARQLLSAGRRR